MTRFYPLDTNPTPAGVHYLMKSPDAQLALLSCVLSLIQPELASCQEIPARLLQEDFQIMRHALEESHGGLYRYTSKAEMDRAFDQAYQKIDHPMTALEFWALVTPVIVRIKDGHLFTYWPEKFPIDQLPLLPLTVRVLDRRPFMFL